jgi:4'-phosphopantetheinyl transferase
MLPVAALGNLEDTVRFGGFDVLIGGWAVAPAALTIHTDEAHIWKVSLACGDSPDLDALLSDEERERASRFHFEKDRQRYRIAHASLRMILSRYLNLTPDALVFGETHYGKPFLTNLEAAGLLFNLSHSQDLALVTVTREREVGVDVEFVRPDFATSEAAEHFFSVAELYTLTGLAPELRTKAFFDCWTRKEAYIKARGLGLSLALNSFDVSLTPGLPPSLLHHRLDPHEVSRWDLHEINPAPNYAATVAIECVPPVAHFRQFVLAE